MENRVADFQSHKWLRLAHELQERLLAFAEEDRFIPDSEAAFQLYLDVVSGEFFDPVDEPAFVSFVDWFIHDYPLKEGGGLNLIQFFLQEKEDQLGPMEEKLLQDWSLSHISLLGVRAVGEGWLVLEDLLAGGEYPVQEGNTGGMVPGTILLGRMVRVGENYQLSGAALEFTPLLRKDIIRVIERYRSLWLEDNPGKPWEEFLKEEGFKLPAVITSLLEGKEDIGSGSRERGEGSEGDWPNPQQLVVQMMEHYYRRWVDLSVPAFDGKTPREMCETETGREEVEALLEDLERVEAGKRRKGEAYFDFNKIRAILGLPLKRNNVQGLPDPLYREVTRLLEENGGSTNWVTTAKRLWQDFYKQAQPRVKKAPAWAAAVTYTMARLFSDDDITQKELARRFKVAPGTISNHYRTIWDTLGLQRFDQRYTR